MTFVKICGITNLEDALIAIDTGADILGFNFYPKSPRYICPEAAGQIIEKTLDRVWTAGVFVNEKVEQIYEATLASHIDVVQLHGDEPASYQLDIHIWLGLDIIKAIPTSGGFDKKWLEDDPDTSILVDGSSPGLYGGTGEVADWEKSKAIAASHPRVYLAGGLTRENVADAIRIVKPYAVDVASGVESSPGKKDPKKLENFINAVRTVRL